MTKEEHIAYWLKSAEHDLNAAESLFQSGKYDWCLFIGHLVWSDIDLALVSEIFEGNRIKDRGKIRRITLSVSSDIEILPYRPQDFTTDDPFVKEIIETGIRII